MIKIQNLRHVFSLPFQFFCVIFFHQGVMHLGAETTRDTIPSSRSATLRAGQTRLRSFGCAQDDQKKVLFCDRRFGDAQGGQNEIEKYFLNTLVKFAIINKIYL